MKSRVCTEYVSRIPIKLGKSVQSFTRPYFKLKKYYFAFFSHFIPQFMAGNDSYALIIDQRNFLILQVPYLYGN